MARSANRDPANRGPAFSDRTVALLLRAAGGLNLTALLFAFGPRSLLEWGHRTLLTEPFPEAPIAEYLARSASLLYAFHGCLLLFATTDVPKFAGWLKLYGGLMLAAGVCFLIVDLMSDMPAWWAWGEAATLLIGGSLVLWLMRGR
ncbi:hypothetical protein [Alienimonas chondri]|uniref:DUF423 domain-containing protein n=1 Tax=Alienimonas chondri TaxID=2681879 RepID=A0ABX1VD52_9PLAN|nr:hypothetical protein [Alienimonas chondri]NNJ25845.1 hypothetical protein [Alienimonas chondri]